MYKKIAQFGALAVLIGSGGGLWGIEQYIDYAPGLNPSPIAIAKNSQLASSALGNVDTSDTGIKGEEYYIKNSEQIDADFATMQAKIQEIARTRYPLMANNCDMKRIQENFDGNEKIDRTICKPNRVAGVIANRFLDNLFAYPDNRPVMEEVIAVKWALVNADNANDPEVQATKADLREYQIFLNDFVTTQYTNLQKKKETANFNNSLTKGKYLGLEIAFLFAEQEKLIVDYILGAENNNLAYRFSSWTCYDGTTQNNTDTTSCKLSSQWRQYAEDFCQNKCSSSTGKCGVNNFSNTNACNYN